MICPHCSQQVPDGLAICFHCGQSTAASAAPPPPQVQVQPQPARQPPEASRPPGLKRFEPEPLNTRPMHRGVRGTGVVCLIAFIAWLTALIGPFAALSRVVKGLWMLIPDLLDGTVTGVADSFLETFALNAETFSGAYSLWKLANEIFGAVGGYMTFLLGMLIVFAVAIPMLFLLVALRKNVRAAQIILIVNLLLCALGDWLCYGVVKKIASAIGVLQPPYDNAPLIALLTMAAAAALWAVGMAIYVSLAAKSKPLGAQ